MSTETTEATTTNGWVPISREELEYQIRPWLGPRYRRWLYERVQSWPHDSSAVMIPRDLYEVHRARPEMSPLTREQKQRLGLK